MIRDTIKQSLIDAMKSGETARRDAIRLIQAALKNRDIELRGNANPPEDDVLVTEVLQKMIKQRRESIEMYEKGNRAELAAAEAAEVAVIEAFLPRQMSDANWRRYDATSPIPRLIGAGHGLVMAYKGTHAATRHDKPPSR